MRGQRWSSDERERDVVRLWRRGHLGNASIRCYLGWIHRFLDYCRERHLTDTDQLTLEGIDKFILREPVRRVDVLAPATGAVARRALHAWACALEGLGIVLPPWRNKEETCSFSPLIREYSSYRRCHNGIAEGTLRRDTDTAAAFLALLRQRGKGFARTTIADIDAFISVLSGRVSKRTLADRCSSLRAFLRFLRVTSRLTHDFAEEVIAPRINVFERPPRALPWSDVRRLLRSIPQSVAPGKRDFAMLLLMATYGLGTAEVLNLSMDNVNWKQRIIRVRRSKTGNAIELPLLDAVAKALTAYLKVERPPAPLVRRIFLRTRMPYKPLTSGAVRHRIRHYAQRVGISAPIIGGHALRHSHATRLVDAGANLKVISDIMGHRRVSSTSVYVRVALKNLRNVTLPVPR